MTEPTKRAVTSAGRSQEGVQDEAVAAPFRDGAQQRHHPAVREPEAIARRGAVRVGRTHLHEVGHDLHVACRHEAGQPTPFVLAVHHEPGREPSEPSQADRRGRQSPGQAAARREDVVHGHDERPLQAPLQHLQARQAAAAGAPVGQLPLDVDDVDVPQAGCRAAQLR